MGARVDAPVTYNFIIKHDWYITGKPEGIYPF